jgi:hypothetical protein
MIRIVRLKNGEDIVGNVIDGNTGVYTVEEPMSVNIDYRGNEAGLIMQHWLPVQLIKKNQIEINDKDILCMFDPADTFCEYYINTVEKIKELLAAKNLVDSMKDEEVNDIMDAYEELEQYGNTLH